MNRDRHPGDRDDEPEVEDYYEDEPRSIFAALWFRALLAVLILGVLAAVVVPYVLDYVTRSTSETTKKSTSPPPPVTPPTARPVATAQPSAPAPAPAAVPPATASPEAPATVAPPAPPATPPRAAAPPPATVQPARVAPTKNIAKNVEVPKEPARVASASKPAATKAANVVAAGGTYWVQVGAFKDAETAKRVAAQLRQQGFPAEQSSTTVKGGAVAGKGGAVAAPAESSGDRYSVIVSGGSPGDIDAKLAAKGMTGEATAGGTAVQPSLPLREAVALSRELADAGLTVQVRRQGGAAPSAPAPTAGATWYRVRVGGFPDRAAAMAALKKLEDKGYKPFIATGNE
jgi:cell division septation protein DedD